MYFVLYLIKRLTKLLTKLYKIREDDSEVQENGEDEHEVAQSDRGRKNLLHGVESARSCTCMRAGTSPQGDKTPEVAHLKYSWCPGEALTSLELKPGGIFPCKSL